MGRVKGANGEKVDGQPLFSAKYKLDNAMVHEAVSLMSHGRSRVLAGGFAIVVVAAVALLSSDPDNLMFFAILAFCAILFSSSVVSGWDNIQLNRLAKSGIIAEGGKADQLRRQVDVYRDHIDCTSLGVTTSYPVSGIRRVSLGDGLCLIDLGSERFALVPAACMGGSGYHEMVEFLREVAPSRAFR